MRFLVFYGWQLPQFIVCVVVFFFVALPFENDALIFVPISSQYLVRVARRPTSPQIHVTGSAFKYTLGRWQIH